MLRHTSDKCGVSELGPEDFLNTAKRLDSYQDRLDYIEYCLHNLKSCSIRECHTLSKAWVDGRLGHTYAKCGVSGSTPQADARIAPQIRRTQSDR